MSRDHNGDTGALREDSQINQSSNHKEVIDAAEEADTECNADLGGDTFSNLPDGGPDYVWNNDYDTAAESAMKNIDYASMHIKPPLRPAVSKPHFPLSKVMHILPQTI
jgi:hypothetical protein